MLRGPVCESPSLVTGYVGVLHRAKLHGFGHISNVTPILRSGFRTIAADIPNVSVFRAVWLPFHGTWDISTKQLRDSPRFEGLRVLVTCLAATPQ